MSTHPEQRDPTMCPLIEAKLVPGCSNREEEDPVVLPGKVERAGMCSLEFATWLGSYLCVLDRPNMISGSRTITSRTVVVLLETRGSSYICILRYVSKGILRLAPSRVQLDVKPDRHCRRPINWLRGKTSPTSHASCPRLLGRQLVRQNEAYQGVPPNSKLCRSPQPTVVNTTLTQPITLADYCSPPRTVHILLE
jgi:hypothetical protein